MVFRRCPFQSDKKKKKKKKSLVYRALLSAQIQLNASKLIGWCFTVQIDNHPNHIKKAKWNVLEGSSNSTDLNPIEHAFNQLKRKKGR